MKIVYESLVSELEKLKNDALTNGRKIDHVIVNSREAKSLIAETGKDALMRKGYDNFVGVRVVLSEDAQCDD